MKKLSFCTLFFLFFALNLNAKKYWVSFTDKPSVAFDPYSYFDIKTINYRLQNNIPLSDECDLPLNAEYVNKVHAVSGKILAESRWLNAVAVDMNSRQANRIKQLPFVASVTDVAVLQTTSAESRISISNPEDLRLAAAKQLSRMGGNYFKNMGIDGTGMRIAVFDGGFPGVDQHPVFKHLRDNNQIVGTWNFPKNSPNVYRGVSHGTMVLSCIAGKYGDIDLGLATGAEFLLATVEVNYEVISEEISWVLAVEWAARNGANLINSSLGYINHRYFPSDMNGHTSMASRGALIAARKGILVVNAAGNEGVNGRWLVIGAPADADSVIAVGGISQKTNHHISFSSYGPTADGRLKPNVTAYGTAIVPTGSGFEYVDGTSFASPLLCGFAACAWQMNRSLNNMQMLQEIQKSGDLYPYFDYAHGYGTPQATYFTKEQNDVQPTFVIEKSNDSIVITVDKRFFPMHAESNTYKLYFHLQKNNRLLKRYAIAEVFQPEVLKFAIKDLQEDDIKTVRVHFMGYTMSYDL